MSKIYSEPLVSILVLDFKKPEETKLCLESLQKNIKFKTKIIYLHNGGDDNYGYQYFKDGLIDQFIQTRQNNGLGIGTRDLFAACFSPYAIYCQNDQFLAYDFSEKYLNELIHGLEYIKLGSISLAGAPCGRNIYSERAHIIKTDFYKKLESDGLLGFHGAGPYHDGDWREAQIQKYYKDNYLIHHTDSYPIFIDNGREAVRQNPDGSLWVHYPDTKQLWLKHGPVKEKYI